jgi:hypothetical protein
MMLTRGEEIETSAPLLLFLGETDCRTDSGVAHGPGQVLFGLGVHPLKHRVEHFLRRFAPQE